MLGKSLNNLMLVYFLIYLIPLLESFWKMMSGCTDECHIIPFSSILYYIHKEKHPGSNPSKQVSPPLAA
jgi:hypothetical protein